MCFRKERFLREFRPARGGGRRSMISRLVATPRRRRTEAGGLGSESWPGRTGAPSRSPWSPYTVQVPSLSPSTSS